MIKRWYEVAEDESYYQIGRKKRIYELHQLSQTTTRLDQLEDNEWRSIPVESRKHRYEKLQELHEQLSEALDSIFKGYYRHKTVIKLRFGIGEIHGYTLQEIADRFKVSKQRIKIIETEAMTRLRIPEIIEKYHLDTLFKEHKEVYKWR